MIFDPHVVFFTTWGLYSKFSLGVPLPPRPRGLVFGQPLTGSFQLTPAMPTFFGLMEVYVLQGLQDYYNGHFSAKNKSQQL